ncbi:MAG: ABC transporter permease [Elusimicrobiota bacterium]
MSLRRAGAVALRQFYLIRGSLSRVVPLFAWVAVDIVLWGFFTRYLNSAATARFNFVPTLLGAVLLWDFFTRVMQGVTMAFFEDVWSRNFLNLFATPLSIAEYLAGLIASSVATSAVGLAVMIALASAIFGLSIFAYGALLAPFLLVLFLFGVALGVLAVALVLRFGPAAEWFVWPIPAMIAPFAGVFYPISTLPRWMRLVSHLLPPSYLFEAMRGIVAGKAASWDYLALSAGLAALYLVLSGRVFAATFRYCARMGLIARYSAESVN